MRASTPVLRLAHAPPQSFDPSFSMQALVYLGPGQKELRDCPSPQLHHATDALVDITRTTLCGTDLHILAGHVPSCAPGRILGHEGVGVVTAVGDGVTTLTAGDQVLISCITSCGRCEPCRRGMPSHCASGGWLLGNRIDGTQAETVRIPFADTSLYRLPAGLDEERLVMLSDVLPTGLECGVLRGAVAPGTSVAIVGAGPIGLAAAMTAQLWSPTQLVMIDPNEHRLGVAKALGASDLISGSADEATAAVMLLTGGRGVDTVIEAVGTAPAFALCQDLVAAGGVIANVGVHGSKVELQLDRLWSRNVTITTRLVDTLTIPMLLRLVAAGRLHPELLISHHFALGEIVAAYGVFADARHTHALKVILAAG
jgi:alcohol dehydrogenase